MVMPGLSGIQVLEQLKLTHPEMRSNSCSRAKGTIETAVQAMKLGAYDFLSKPFPLAELEVLIEKAYERHQLRKENVQLKEVLSRSQADPEIIGNLGSHAGGLPLDRARRPHRQGDSDPRRKRHRKRTRCQGAASRQRAGRQADGRHQLRGAARGDCSKASCSVTRKGSFTGAVGAKPGLFEVADGGTLFIDEIGELAGSLQAKLLRVLEDGSLRRVGSVKERRVDVRLLAATNRDMEKEVAGGRFREDLYYRINVMSLAASAAARTAGRHSAVGQALARAGMDGRPAGDAARWRLTAGPEMSVNCSMRWSALKS